MTPATVPLGVRSCFVRYYQSALANSVCLYGLHASSVMYLLRFDRIYIYRNLVLP